MASTLSAFTIPDTKVTLVFVRDRIIPFGVSAFFMRRSSATTVARIRIKDKKRLLKSNQQRAQIIALMDGIATRFDYSFDQLVEAGKQNKEIY
jgi:hypothetical protein